MRFLQSILFPYAAIVAILSLLWVSFLIFLLISSVKEELYWWSREREEKRHPPALQTARGDSFPLGGPHWTEEERRRQQEIVNEEQSRAIAARSAAEHPVDFGSHPAYPYYPPKGDLYRLGYTVDQSTDNDSGDPNE